MGSSNWELCKMACYLQDTLKVPSPPAPKEVQERGQEKEDVVAKRHPNWKTQQTMTLPTGRKCRLDFLDENGGPVEVKGMSKASMEKFNTAEDFLNAPYKYQVEYLVQLSAYCVLTNKSGRFVLVEHKTLEDKEIPVSLQYATEIWNKFLVRDIKIPSCMFCKMDQGCTVFTKLQKKCKDPNRFNETMGRRPETKPRVSIAHLDVTEYHQCL